MKDDWIVASLSKSYQPFLLNLLLKNLLENKWLTQFLIVSSKVMLVNNHSISRPATTQHQGQPYKGYDRNWQLLQQNQNNFSQ